MSCTKRRHWLEVILLSCAAFAQPTVAQQHCGAERWSVKTGTDADAQRVDLAHPRSVSISSLIALPAPHPIRQGFEFRNVSFHYPGTERLILNGLHFRLDPSERIALIGQNGQGKTTIVKLLTRLYDPTEGRILLDGADLRDYNLERRAR